MNKKVLDEFPNYEIYENGQIINKKTNRNRKQRVHKSGHLRCDISNYNKKPITRTIHSLVYEAFYDEYVAWPMVIDHIDNNKTNNHYLNLQKITSTQNTIKSLLIKNSKITGLPYLIKENKKKNNYYFYYKNEILFEDYNLINVVLYRDRYMKINYLFGVIC